MLFHHNKAVQDAARELFKKYIDSVMSSSYGDLEVVHNCLKKEDTLKSTNLVATEDDDLECSQACNATFIRQVTGKANTLFYDYDCNDSDAEEQLQRVRNTRSMFKKEAIGGEILHCKGCEALFSTQEVVEMLLSYHKNRTGSGIILPILDKRLDISTY